MKVLGLMSGTSMDGLDCCLSDIEIINGCLVFKILNYKTYKFNLKSKKIIYDYIFNNKYSISYIGKYLGSLFSKYSFDFLNNKNIDLIGLHGQTVSHINGKYSLQVANPIDLYKSIKVPVIYNFRTKDIENGGNGAPLVPFLDWMLFKDFNYNVLSINIGGISNFSLIKSGSLKKNIIGFDTGPGMCLVDRYVNTFFKVDIDNYGKLASKGKIDSRLLNYLLKDEFINKIPPKSASTEMYDSNYILSLSNKFSSINKYNFLRTLLNFTAKSIKKNIDLFIDSKIENLTNVLISGGGVKNNILYADMIKEFKNYKNIKKLNHKNINIDNKEAFLMCVLGYTSYNNIYNNIPSVTGANKEVVLGDIYE